MRIFVIGILLICFGGTYVAAGFWETRYVYEIESEIFEENQIQYQWANRPLYLGRGYTPAEEAYLVFDYFFDRAAYCVPEGVSVLGVKIEDGCLWLNVSAEILAYGGNTFERALIAQCYKTATALPGVERLTLLVDSIVQTLPEGRLVENYKELEQNGQ